MAGPTHSISIRSAGLDDAPALAAVHVAAWRETYAGLVPAEMLAELPVNERTAMWRQILGDQDASAVSVQIAGGQDGPVGFASCCRQRDGALAAQGFDGEIGAIYILQSHQRWGLGGSLMRLMAQDLLQFGCRAMTLWVLRENAAARAFYERLGGVVVGAKQDKRGAAVLDEVAYGWPELSRLARMRP